jgi:nicotinamidase-related amidase
MPAKNPDLHGMVPDHSDVVLLLIDVINDLEFDTGAELFEHAMPMAQKIAALKARAREEGIPAIYVNDNFGRWRSDLRALVKHCLEDGVRGEPIVRLLQPDDEDYFVLKPKHSGFFSTTLDTLLAYLKAKTLVLTGLTGNFCVFLTASDAFMRDYIIVVPKDCVASIKPEDNEYALEQMRVVLDADLTVSDDLSFERLLHRTARHGDDTPKPDPQPEHFGRYGASREAT